MQRVCIPTKNQKSMLTYFNLCTKVILCNTCEIGTYKSLMKGNDAASGAMITPTIAVHVKENNKCIAS